MRAGRTNRAVQAPPVRCPRCGLAPAGCRCARAAPEPARVRVGRETQGRGGRGVTVVHGLALDAAALEVLCGELKRRLGTGGRVRGAVLELQGEHRDALLAVLTQRGYRAQRSGG